MNSKLEPRILTLNCPVNKLDPFDIEQLNRAIEIAERGRGHVSPNPMVGAVVCRDGAVLGEGWHAAYGEDHAEVAAIKAAGGNEACEGATIYVSLEPCCHQGRTPPCTDAVLGARIERVVIASDDPSGKANGRGLGILRDEGVAVDSADGELKRSAELLNQPFRKHSRTRKPLVVAKYASSLDGKVASQTGDSKWISSAESRTLVHRWRSEFDAIAVGIGTALADDPLLTAREVNAARQPRRVVFDSAGKLPLDSKLVADVEVAPVTVIAGRAAERATLDGLRASGVDVIIATGENEAARVTSALEQLGDSGVTSLLLEGGPRLAGAFLDSGEIDQVRAFIAPVLIGARMARDPFEGAGADLVSDAVKLPALEVERIGQDLLISSRLREW